MRQQDFAPKNQHKTNLAARRKLMVENLLVLFVVASLINLPLIHDPAHVPKLPRIQTVRRPWKVKRSTF